MDGSGMSNARLAIFSARRTTQFFSAFARFHRQQFLNGPMPKAASA
jgi:hypothetical protein